MTTELTLSQIAALVGGEVRGDDAHRVSGMAAVQSAGPGDLTWITNARYIPQLGASAAGAVLVRRDFDETPMPAILCDDVELAVAKCLGAFAPATEGPSIGVHPSAQVDPTATIGRNTAIAAHVVIGPRAHVGDETTLDAGVFVGADTRIGSGCRLWPNVVVRERCTLGDRVVVNSNTVIGSDGYGFFHRAGRHHRVPHIGCVIIGDDVEIGANCCIDRSKVGATTIGEGTKIDNLVQVAHNVHIGAHCLICALTGIAGSAKLGNNVVLGGQVGVRDNIVLGDGVIVAACASVARDIPAGTHVAGAPAIEGRRFRRQNAALHKLPDLIVQLRELNRRVQELESTDHQPNR